MPLEATMIIIDNSEYMRNGDYPPTRFDAQGDAVHIVFETKCDSNPENTVGVMTMAGKAPEVLITSSRELGQVLQAIHSVSSKISGTADIPTAINVAQLALKHRSNKNLRQRILVFTSSPLEGPNANEANLLRLAKKLKKNNIAVDIICFGDAIEEGEESPLLKKFVENVNSSDNSHFLSVTPDPSRLLADAITRSSVLAADRGAVDEAMGELTNTGGGAGGGEFGDLGVDPSLDPELAMALRMSLEEDNARRAAAESAAAQSSAQPTDAQSSSSGATSAPAMPPTPAPAHATAVSPEDLDEDAMLRQALALSEQSEDVEMSDHALAPGAAEDDEDMDEEEAIARAIQMSMQKEGQGEEKKQ